MVANRLPLRLGMIPAPQHTPLRILLEAGRRMLDSNWMGSEDWQVGQLDDWHGLSLEKEGHQVAWQFASAEEDSKVLDPWRPYMTTDSPPTESQRHLDRRYYYAPGLRRGSARIAYVHAGEAVPGGCLEFTPSTFDFAWLDNLADRFEITYDPRGIRLGLAKRPYILDELTLLEKIWEVLRSNLSINQIYILRMLSKIAGNHGSPIRVIARREERSGSSVGTPFAMLNGKLARISIGMVGQTTQCGGGLPTP